MVFPFSPFPSFEQGIFPPICGYYGTNLPLQIPIPRSPISIPFSQPQGSIIIRPLCNIVGGRSWLSSGVLPHNLVKLVFVLRGQKKVWRNTRVYLSRVAFRGKIFTNIRHEALFLRLLSSFYRKQQTKKGKILIQTLF